MDEKMLKYRQVHHRCDFCEYYKKQTVGIGYVTLCECALKDKTINHPFLTGSICRHYTIKETQKGTK